MMKKLSPLFGSVLDFLWVLQAYLRGKVLRQKNYRLQGNFFRLATATNYKRITMLMKWWGHRSATTAEIRSLLAQTSGSMVKSPEPSFWFGPVHMQPYLRWNDGAWRLRYECDWFDPNGLTFPPRKF